MRNLNLKSSIGTLLLTMSIILMTNCTMEGIEPYDNKLPEIEELSSTVTGQENLRRSDQNQLLAEMRRLTAKYQRLEVAEAAGYTLDREHCVSHPELGGMGHHAPNFGLVDGEYDIFTPEVMVYEPMDNGKMKLVAIEYVIMADFWEGETPPMFGEVEFDFVPANPMGLPFDNFQLHVWIWKHNPSGMYAPFNPTVNCQ
ncbi:hypothetical protein SAMN06295967_10838 [Belliella buryatensis]|uniref:Uncharacterized protein n=1 Tax=Belliella buryatensis TaxID=1500549 RepID=A0A239DX03_9BACT|nr:hypothetical protein [Belliella buryatensis]SNS36144.1 hypothetical protein SAMN06295967_10838 [Belliella buryatensis]